MAIEFTLDPGQRRLRAAAREIAKLPLVDGASDEFDTSITDFSERYADQNERDFEEFVKAVSSGRLEAVEGV